MKPLKISEVAKRLNVSKRTIWDWKNKGKVHFQKIGSQNFISFEEFCDLAHIKLEKEEKVVIYARVSFSTNKDNLESQADRLTQYCTAKGYKIYKIIKEVGSGINDNRKLLSNLLEKQDFTKIVVEHKDRLTRIGFNYIKILLEAFGKQIEVVNEAEGSKAEIIEDFVSIITSYCARIYGHRRSKRKTEKIIKQLNLEE